MFCEKKTNARINDVHERALTIVYRNTLRTLIFVDIYFRKLNEKKFREPIIGKVSRTFIFCESKENI